jgi:hypothetical protein
MTYNPPGIFLARLDIHYESPERSALLLLELCM